MFVDYITLMLLNLAAGLTLLAAYLHFGWPAAVTDLNQKRWVVSFGIAGSIALVTGLHMCLTWPVIGSFNIAFGETSVLFGVLLVGASLSLAMGWDLLPLGIYGFFAGLTALVIGLRIINLGLTRSPLVAGIGFILTGIGGLCAAPMLASKSNRLLRTAGIFLLLAAALIFTFIGISSYWSHLESFSDWKPLPMRSP